MSRSAPNLLKRHFSGRYLDLLERDGWEFTSRSNASAVVALVAVTAAREVILVEQYREPVQRRVLELPAGLVGDSSDPHEPLETAAQRELEEETGYRAGRLRAIVTSPSTAGLSDELITFFLAEDLHRTGPGGGDASEDIEVHRVPLAAIDQWLGERLRGEVLLDPKVYTALYWLSDPRHLEPLWGLVPS